MVPIVIICIINVIFIGLIIRSRIKNSKKENTFKDSFNSVNRYSTGKLNFITLLGCVLFSGNLYLDLSNNFEQTKSSYFNKLKGITWIGLPLSLIQNSDVVNGFNYFFTAVNALQGVFIFAYFIIAVQVLLKRKTKYQSI